jgi:hypothetical protein
MKKIIRLTENDLTNIVKRVINEDSRSKKIKDLKKDLGKIMAERFFINDRIVIIVFDVIKHAGSLSSIQGDTIYDETLADIIGTSSEVLKEFRRLGFTTRGYKDTNLEPNEVNSITKKITSLMNDLIESLRKVK